jgi:hypothetical protein
MPLSDQKKPTRARANQPAPKQVGVPVKLKPKPTAEALKAEEPKVEPTKAVAKVEPSKTHTVVFDTSVLLKELTRAEEVIDNVLKSRSLDEMMSYGRLLNQVEGVTGVTKMRFLFLAQKKWPEWQAQSIVDDTWEDTLRAGIGITPNAAKKYIRAWETLWEGRAIPDGLRNDWLGKPVSHWVRLVGTADKLTKPQWDAATKARYDTEVAEIAKAARGGKARTSSEKRITLQLKRDGTLRAWQGGGQPQTVGKLDLKNKNTVVVRSIARILSAAGIVEE